MKSVIFVGPSLHGVNKSELPVDSVRGPAKAGDLAGAVIDGFQCIGLVDGLFGEVAAVWHKEILFALERGARVLGSSSMGALRAAECAAFGMEPVGNIARDYCTGVQNDDAWVALRHAPEEFDYAPFTLPMVDVECTLNRLRKLALIDETEHDALQCAAVVTHFAERDLHAIFGCDGNMTFSRKETLKAMFDENFVSQKKLDALSLIEELQNPKPFLTEPLWRLNQSVSWRRLMEATRGRMR